MAEFVLEEILDGNGDDENLLRIRTFLDLQDPFFGLDDNGVYQRYRFTRPVIFEIVDMLKDDIEHATTRSRAMPPLHQVCIGLRYVASNGFQQLIGDTIRVNKSTASRCVWRFAKSLVKHLNNYVKISNNFDAEKRKFFEMAGFPNVIGLIDCTHVSIITPSHHPEVFLNRKGFRSINVQCVCRADGGFSNIVAKWPGSAHDSRIFRESSVFVSLNNNRLHNGHLLGDSGYPCLPFLLTPFPNLQNPGLQRFNIAHKCTRVLVEQMIGRWKRRFACLHSQLRVTPEKSCLLITCCSILHNIAILNNLPDDFGDEQFPPEDDDDEPLDAGHNFGNGAHYRNNIVAHYFARQ